MDKQPVYINLYHGRLDPYEQMDDWGTEGPTLGPFAHVQVTYLNVIRAIDEDGMDYFITVSDDLVKYDGVYYGDWSISAEPYSEPIMPD